MKNMDDIFIAGFVAGYKMAKGELEDPGQATPELEEKARKHAPIIDHKPTQLQAYQQFVRNSK